MKYDSHWLPYNIYFSHVSLMLSHHHVLLVLPQKKFVEITCLYTLQTLSTHALLAFHYIILHMSLVHICDPHEKNTRLCNYVTYKQINYIKYKYRCNIPKTFNRFLHLYMYVTVF